MSVRILLVVVLAFTSAPAWACWPVDVDKSLSWTAAPRDLAPNEAALEVILDRQTPSAPYVPVQEPGEPETVVITCRGNYLFTFKVVRVLAGHFEGREISLQSDGLWTLPTSGPAIIVGRSRPFRLAAAYGQPAPSDEPIELFKLRWPAQ